MRLSGPAPLLAQSVGTALHVDDIRESGVGDHILRLRTSVRNLGSEPLAPIDLRADLAAQLGSAFLGLTSPPVVEGSSTDATVLPVVSSSGSQWLHGQSGQLDPGQTLTLLVDVRIDADAIPGPLLIQVEGGGIGTFGQRLLDRSDDGLDPAGPNPGEAGDTGGLDDPTPIRIVALGVAKAVTHDEIIGDQALIEYTLQLRNVGNVSLEELTLRDDLTTNLGAAFDSLLIAPAIVSSDAASVPALTGTFPEIFDGASGLLEPGQTVVVAFTLQVNPAELTSLRIINQAEGGATKELCSRGVSGVPFVGLGASQTSLGGYFAPTGVDTYAGFGAGIFGGCGGFNIKNPRKEPCCNGSSPAGPPTIGAAPGSGPRPVPTISPAR